MMPKQSCSVAGKGIQTFWAASHPQLLLKYRLRNADLKIIANPINIPGTLQTQPSKIVIRVL